MSSAPAAASPVPAAQMLRRVRPPAPPWSLTWVARPVGLRGPGWVPTARHRGRNLLALPAADAASAQRALEEALLALAYVELNRGDIATGVRRAGAAAAWGAAGARELLAQVRTKADGLADTAIVHEVDTQLARPLKG